MARVLVIEDSALMRKHLRSILEGAGHEVDTARNGEEGLHKLDESMPDVVTLDINMPVMDGLTCLSLIMQQHPVPVVMVSSLTEKGAIATFEALELGAVDYVAKPGGTVSLNIQDVSEEIIEKVESAATANIRRRRKAVAKPVAAARDSAPAKKTPVKKTRASAATGMVLVGVSTGGPGTVESIVAELPAGFPLPLVVVQHMPARFTRVFAERLDRNVELSVSEVSGPTELEQGCVYIARGDADVKMTRRGSRVFVTPIPSSDKYLWHPSVDRMAESVLSVCDPRDVICVQLTGMGNDGAKTMAELKRAGARTIAESEETAVVYGMPRELVELGAADCVLPSYSIAEKLLEWVN